MYLKALSGNSPWVIYVCVCHTFIVLCSYFIAFFFIYLLGGSFEASRVAHTHTNTDRILEGHVVMHAASADGNSAASGHIWRLSSRTWAATIVLNIFATPRSIFPPSLSLTLACFAFCLLGELWVGRRAQSAQRTRKLCCTLLLSPLTLLSLFGFLVLTTFN